MIFICLKFTFRDLIFVHCSLLSAAQLESLLTDNQTLESRNSQLMRRIRALESELETLRAQVAARDIAIEEACVEVKALKVQSTQSEGADLMQLKNERLSEEVL